MRNTIPPFIPAFCVFLLAFCHGADDSEGAVLREKETPLVRTRNNYFSIPFEIKAEPSKEQPREIELTYSTDCGMSWLSGGRVAPDRKQFLFRAPSDGEYWFHFKTYGSDGVAKQLARRGPMLRVLIDTVPPRLELNAEQKSTGEISLDWSMEDANLPRKTPKIQLSYYVPARDTLNFFNWKPIAIDPATVLTQENKHSGGVLFWPERGAVSVEIQAEIVDSSGNREMQSRTLTLDASLSGVEADVSDDSVRTRQAPFDIASGSRVGLNSRSNSGAKPPGLTAFATEKITALTPPRPIRLNSTVPNPTVAGGHALSLPGSSNALAANSDVNSDTGRAGILTAGELSRALRLRAATGSEKTVPRIGSLNLEDTAGRESTFAPFPQYGSQVSSESEPVSEPENGDSHVSEGSNNTEKNEEDEELVLGPPLFYDDFFGIGSEETRNHVSENEHSVKNEPEGAPVILPDFDAVEPVPAQRNTRYESEREIRTEPAIENVIRETPRSDPLSDSGETTAPNAAAPVLEKTEISESWKTGAILKISKVSLLNHGDTNRILVKWNVDAHSWLSAQDVKIHLYRGKSQDGPWIPIAENRKNTGTYSWNISAEDRHPFYIQLRGEGAERERAVDTTLHSIRLPESLLSPSEQAVR